MAWGKDSLLGMLSSVWTSISEALFSASEEDLDAAAQMDVDAPIEDAMEQVMEDVPDVAAEAEVETQQMDDSVTR